MGFAIYYRSLEVVGPKQRVALDAACEELCRGFGWLSCEPVHFDRVDDSHLTGSSKPVFAPAAVELSADGEEELSDGTIQDVLAMLCQLSRDHGVDWEISHDCSDGPVGCIRDGQADADVVEQITGLGAVGDVFRELDQGDASGDSSDGGNDRPGLRLFEPDEE